MSEELRAKYLKNAKIVGQKIGLYEYFNIGATTFNQLSKSNIVPSVYSDVYAKKKPDRLIVNRLNKSKPTVIAVVEDKDTGVFSSSLEKAKRLSKTKEGVWLKPENPNYKPIPVGPEDNMVIWGVVVGVVRQKL